MPLGGFGLLSDEHIFNCCKDALLLCFGEFCNGIENLLHFWCSPRFGFGAFDAKEFIKRDAENVAEWQGER